MIFLTVGGQLPFDRLVQTLDEIAPEIPELIYGQIGKSEYIPQNFEFARFLDPIEFKARFEQARVVVGHAGIGTILAAKDHETPAILMARRAHLREHRNDHQLATVAQLGETRGIHVAENGETILSLISNPDLQKPQPGTSPSRGALVEFLSSELKSVMQKADKKKMR